jgi:hypothetical protein
LSERNRIVAELSGQRPTRSVPGIRLLGSTPGDPFDLLKVTCGATSGQKTESLKNSHISARKGTTSHVCSLQTEVLLPYIPALLQIGGYSKCVDVPEMASLVHEYSVPFQRGQCRTWSTQAAHGGSDAGSSTTRRPSLRNKELSMYNFLKDNFVVPLDSICRTRVWLQSPYRNIRNSNADFRDLCDVIQSEFLHCSLSELYSFWQALPYRFWELPEQERLGLKCYSETESVDLAYTFLMFQFNSDEDSAISFCSNLASLLNRETRKKNCLEIISPPSSGKNWFLDPLLTFMTSKGQISNAKKGNNFPLDNCFNKRRTYVQVTRQAYMATRIFTIQTCHLLKIQI